MSTNDKEHGGYVDKVREEMQTYVQKLLKENHDLRGLVVELKAENGRLADDLRAREERASELDGKLDEIRAVNEQYLAQYAQLEQHNANLANLYVASYQLHGTLDRQAVLDAMQEIIINLVGSEEFAILESDPRGELRPVACMGIEDPAGLHHREARIAQSATSGDLWVRPPDGDSILTACIPLKLDGRVTGYIAIYRLLAHKSVLEPLDHELFDLLATHAATALYCTSLAERSAARNS